MLCPFPAGFMDKLIRILIVEDDPGDVLLIERELRKGGINFVSQCVRSREEFVAALDGFDPQLILSDHRLAGFDGVAALGIAQEKCPAVPFILVSGVLSEEFALKTMASGAAEYVLKDRLLRLAPMVRRALEQAELRLERQQAEDAGRLIERNFFVLTETVPAVIFIHQGGKFRYLNAAAEAILGHPRGELLGTDFWEIVHPSARELVRKRGLSRADGNDVPSRYEFQIVTKSGQIRWLDCAAAMIQFEGK